MDAGTDFSDSQRAIEASLVATTRAATHITAQDISFHRSLNSSVTASLDQKSRRLLQLTERLLQRSSTGSNKKLNFPSTEAIDDNWGRLVDAADGLFERADSCLDEYSGLIQKQSESEPHPKSSPHPRSSNNSLAGRLRRADLPKPQENFESKSFNHEDTPFRPFLTEKPNASIPLQESVKLFTSEGGEEHYGHPYEQEIQAYSYPRRVWSKCNPQHYKPFAETSATFVDSEDGLESMLGELTKAKEIAIDLEHHDYRTYIGMVSLMQISTRDRDWIVDTLKPWRRKLEALNQVFTDPRILKVFHGAHMDIIWLQRDLGLYIVGLFDTYFAARVLGYPGKSLAYLLKHFINFDAQKQYQTADWRIRPLPPPMLEYARSDTHFLLFICDCMRNQLIEKTEKKIEEGQTRDCVSEVLQLSNEQCLQRYEHAFYQNRADATRSSWAVALMRHPGPMTQQQIGAFARLHQWRDRTARNEDESTQYVMQNHVLMNLSRALPVTSAALLALSHPISSLVKENVEHLVQLIRTAQAEADAMPTLDWIATSQSDDRFTMGAALARAKAESHTLRHNTSAPSGNTARHAHAQQSELLGSALIPDSKPMQLLQQQYRVRMFCSSNTDATTSHVPFGNAAMEYASTADANNQSSFLPTPDSQVLGKRKSQEVLADEVPLSTSGTDDEALVKPKPKSQEADSRAERKAKRRAERECRVNGFSLSSDAALEGRDLRPIPLSQNGSTGGSAQKNRPFLVPALNPFARAEQAAPGLKRSRMQTAGRSQTYRS
ncbi:MAG: hypothetical protein Q9162_005466 [Coniocarpon cinnabarinum]